MGKIEDRLGELGIELPPPPTVPEGVVLPFAFVNVRGGRATIAGHGPVGAGGELTLGMVGADIDVDGGYQAARSVGLSMLTSLHAELGTLDRITGWVKVFGMVRCGPDFAHHPQVINGCSDLILEVFGSDIGRHSRSAVGMVSLPFGMPVEIEAEVLVAE